MHKKSFSDFFSEGYQFIAGIQDEMQNAGLNILASNHTINNILFLNVGMKAA